MIALGLVARKLSIPIWSVLVGGVKLDLGRLTNLLDLTESVAGSSCGGSHSLFDGVLLMMVGVLHRGHANVRLGIVFDALSRLGHNVGTGMVPRQSPERSPARCILDTSPDSAARPWCASPWPLGKTPLAALVYARRVSTHRSSGRERSTSA